MIYGETKGRSLPLGTITNNYVIYPDQAKTHPKCGRACPMLTRTGAAAPVGEVALFGDVVVN
jgi:hypothetical protein